MLWVYQRGWPENSQSSFPARHLQRSRMAQKAADKLLGLEKTIG